MKVFLIASTTWHHYNSRLGLAAALREHGHDVIFLAPDDEFSQLLVERGFQWRHLPMRPRGRNPLREAASILFLASYLYRHKADLVHSFTPKGVIYGSLAARAAGVRSIVNTITGLGHVYTAPANPGLRWLVTRMYGMALRRTTVIFQNADDRRFFEARGITSPGRTRLIRGSGVDVKRFVPAPEPEGIPVVMLPSRFVEEKGLRVFVDASRILKARGTEIRFVLVGRPEQDQPTAIRSDEITAWVGEGAVEWWGWHTGMEQIYPLSHIVCLPTYYMEGVPKSLLEGAACSRPIVATDVPGCRDVVRDGETGLLVPPRDAHRLADAIGQLAADPELRLRMGRAARELVVETFSMEKVLPAYFEAYGIPY